MLQQKFYHSTIRKAIVSFGNMFNNIHIDRRNDAGTVIQTLKVPLAYAPRQKFLAKIAQQPNIPDQNFQVIVPRMAFEMTGIEYDEHRKTSLVQQTRTLANNNTAKFQYGPTPYNVKVSLYAYVKNQDDGLQIIEQILPYFNPDYNLTLNAVPELDIKNDLMIRLDDVSYDDQYDNDFKERRAIIWTLNYTLRLNFYGPVGTKGVIKRAIATTYNDEALTEKIQRYTVAVDPLTANADESYVFQETFEDF